MIRVLNYKNHIYPQGIYFWVYPSSSEGGLSRIFFKLPGGVTGATYIKGTDYFSLSEIAVLESAINEFSMTAQANPPTIISDYETFVCFLGNMPHLQKGDIAIYLPTITVSNRYCYQFDMTQGRIIYNFPPDPGTDPIKLIQSRCTKSATFFSHIFDNGFDGKYKQRNGYVFSPVVNINFDTILKSLYGKLQSLPVTFPWLADLRWKDRLLPVCSFSCIHTDEPMSVLDSIEHWDLTHTVQGLEIFKKCPHPNVCTLAGASAYVVGHRGNMFLNQMVPSRVKNFLPPLPIGRLTTYDARDKQVMTGPSFTRFSKRGRPFRDTGNFLVTPGPDEFVPTRREEIIIDKIVSFFNKFPDNTTSDSIEHTAKMCLLMFLGFDKNIDIRLIGDSSAIIGYLKSNLKSSLTGVQNLISVETVTTYVSMMAADTLQTYLGVQPIHDVPSEESQPPRQPTLMVQVSWLGKNHNYVPVVGRDNRSAFRYNDTDHASEISSIFNSFNPYIIEAHRTTTTFHSRTVVGMVLDEYLAASAATRPPASTPVTVFNKTILMRVIIYNRDVDNYGSESLKFGALEVIVAISSTAALNQGTVYLHFGTDLQFSVVSITACRHTKDDHGNDHFEKVQTFHGTNADIESVGIWGTSKSADYSATAVTHDQFHPELSRFLRPLIAMDVQYNNVSVSPYNTPDHWIMKLFAPVLKNDKTGQDLRNAISIKWEWPLTIEQFYNTKLDPKIIEQLNLNDLAKSVDKKITKIGGILRSMASIFFSDQAILADQADEVVSVADNGSGSEIGSDDGIGSDSDNGMNNLLHGELLPDESGDEFKLEDPGPDSGSEFDSDLAGGRRKPRLNKNKTIRKYKRYRVTNRQKQKSTNAKTKNKNKNKNIKTVKNRNKKRLGSNKSKPKTKSKTKSNLKCKRRITATRRRCRTT